MKTENRNIKLWCTLGPASFDERTVARLDELGVDLFRINLSHTPLECLEDLIVTIQRYTKKPLCLDTEGAQVRTLHLAGGSLLLEEDQEVELVRPAADLREAGLIPLQPGVAIDQIQAGDLISLDFDSALLLALGRGRRGVLAKVMAGGLVASNKAVTVDRPIHLPALTEKDVAAIRIGLRHGLAHFALSFANKRTDVDYFRSQVGRSTEMICKIESAEGVRNIDEILQGADSILIDRGDLSREEPIERIPFIQKFVIAKCKEKGKPVYVATNLMESMVANKKPTRAEVNDVMNTLLDGADGLVLAAETAIGRYPIQCASMVTRMIREFAEGSEDPSLKGFLRGDSLALAEPHGGTLKDGVNRTPDWAFVARLPELAVDETVLKNAEHVARGTYSPLEGFMNEREWSSVVAHCRLPGGAIWPVPVTLSTEGQGARFKCGDRVTLVSRSTGEACALVEVNEVFRVREGGPCHVSGKIEWIRRHSPFSHPNELMPRQVRSIFEGRGWRRVAGWSVPAGGETPDEAAAKSVLEKYHCDGLFLQWLAPSGGEDGADAAARVKECESTWSRSPLKGKILVGLFRVPPEASGFRGRLFEIVCGKNFGCSHWVFGSHAELAAEDPLNENGLLRNRLADLNIVPVVWDGSLEESSRGRKGE
jgi:pyruvate kinase/ATP sulfurylase